MSAKTIDIIMLIDLCFGLILIFIGWAGVLAAIFLIGQAIYWYAVLYPYQSFKRNGLFR